MIDPGLEFFTSQADGVGEGMRIKGVFDLMRQSRSSGKG